jgi:phage gp36-like protein
MYSTLDDIKKLIPEEVVIQLTDDENLGVTNQTRIAEAIASADGEIDSYCGSRYTVPFSPVPDIVRKMSVDIAIYNLYSRRVEEIPATRSDRYKNTIRQLTMIAEGKLTIESTAPPAQEGGAECNKTEDDRIFTRDKLKGY